MTCHAIKFGAKHRDEIVMKVDLLGTSLSLFKFDVKYNLSASGEMRLDDSYENILVRGK